MKEGLIVIFIWLSIGFVIGSLNYDVEFSVCRNTIPLGIHIILPGFKLGCMAEEFRRRK